MNDDDRDDDVDVGDGDGGDVCGNMCVAASWALGTGRSLSTRPWAQPMGYCPSC